MSGISSVLVLLAHCTIFAPALFIPLQLPANATVPSYASPINATNVEERSVIAGFHASLDYAFQYVLKFEYAYLCAIDFMYELSWSGGDVVVASGHELLSKEVEGIVVLFGSLAQPGDKYQLQNRHLILGLLQMINTLASKPSFCTTKATLYMYRKLVGQLAIGRKLPPALAEVNSTETPPSVVDYIANITVNRSLNVRKEIVDPDDSDFVISYETSGDLIPCQTLLNAAVNGLAKSAQARNDDVCTDFAGFNSAGEVVYTIARNPPGSTRLLLNYGQVNKLLKLLPAVMYSEENCGEVSFDLFYWGEELGGGS